MEKETRILEKTKEGAKLVRPSFLVGIGSLSASMTFTNGVGFFAQFVRSLALEQGSSIW
jgi:hypothetical protein